MGTNPSPRLFSSFRPVPRTRSDLRVTTIHLGLLTLLSLLLTWPLLIHGAPDLSHDGLDHARWAKQFATQFWRGDLYPRWFTDVNGGFGGPTGFFYPPLTSYASSLFWPFLAARDPYGWLAAGYAIVLAEILSGITAYFWLRSIAKPGAALLGACVYLVAPYHLAVDVYQRCASAELWVFVWFPLVMLAAQKLIQHSRWSVPGAAVSYGLAVLSHPTLSVCFAPIPVAYVFFFSRRQERIRATGLMAVALSLGVGLNGIYLLPATLDQHKAYVEWQTTGHSDYRNEWLVLDRQQLADMGQYVYAVVARTSQPDSGDRIALKIRMLLVTLATLAAVAALFLVNRRCEQDRRWRAMALFWAAVAVASLFLMTQLSSIVWRMASFLQFLQFPFRFNLLLVITVAALTAIVCHHLLEAQVRLITWFLALMVVFWLGADLYSPTQMFSVWRTNELDRIATNRQFLRTQIDLFTVWPKPGNLNALEHFAAFDLLVTTHPPKTARLEARNGQPSGTAQAESWQPRRVVLKVEALHDTQLTLNHFYYAGWRGRIDGASAPLDVRPSRDGLMEMDVPKGDYDLTIELPRDGAERAGAMISLLSLLLVAGIAAWSRLYPTEQLKFAEQQISPCPAPSHNC